ncbi:LPS export ABC transporter periplasmic protein LptC [Acetonema longum]|uniref:LPS export ABC transporter periplasmic protein LptC n=1 Tax=Acetonema longum DSM 6540 TaxID=1009370 RepID=F7NM00_9FIRM|nr:LPS export ABC transporter periplasmic protein LptC [Acetonema longum]EGO62926.1 hypothetical protein ALO_15632 [Acetonema longum DSM 6540]
MKKSMIAVATVFVVLIGGIIYYFAREEKPEIIQHETVVKEQPDLKFGGASIVEEQDGRKLWELKSDDIQISAKDKKVYFGNLTAVFHREDGTIVTLEARKGILDSTTKNIQLEGDIKAVSPDGATFMAPLAEFKNDIRCLFATGGVRLIRGDTVITGDKLESDLNTELTRVLGNAKAMKGGS